MKFRVVAVLSIILGSSFVLAGTKEPKRTKLEKGAVQKRDWLGVQKQLASTMVENLVEGFKVEKVEDKKGVTAYVCVRRHPIKLGEKLNKPNLVKLETKSDAYTAIKECIGLESAAAQSQVIDRAVDSAKDAAKRKYLNDPDPKVEFYRYNFKGTSMNCDTDYEAALYSYAPTAGDYPTNCSIDVLIGDTDTYVTVTGTFE